MQTKERRTDNKKSARWHTVYSIISTAIEEAVIAAVLVWVLPLFGIMLPMWAILLILVGFAVFSYFMYRIGHPTMLYKEISSPEAIIGSEGTVECSLNPYGYVRICGELWKALGRDGYIGKDEEIVVTGIKGLTLTVIKKTSDIKR